MKRVVLVGLLLLLTVGFSHIFAQSPDIGNHCPAFVYRANRPEWNKSFQTTGEAGRVVHFAGTAQVQVEDWCQTYGQGLVPPFVVQLLALYRFTPNPKTGDTVTDIVSINLATGKLTAKSKFDQVKRLPPLSGAMNYVLVDIYNTGSPIYLALFAAQNEDEQYMQTPEGYLWQVSDS